jgi:hypothetical protein
MLLWTPKPFHFYESTISGKLITTYVEFEVFIAVTMKNAVVLDVATCGYCNIRRFGGTCRLNFKGKKLRERGNC